MNYGLTTLAAEASTPLSAITDQGAKLLADVGPIAAIGLGIAFAPTIWKFGLRLFRSISGAR